jgi:hypothetical protein
MKLFPNFELVVTKNIDEYDFRFTSHYGQCKSVFNVQLFVIAYVGHITNIHAAESRSQSRPV